jgi:hypothetical protein
MALAYKDNGWHAFTSLSLFPKATFNTFVGDADMIKEIVNDRVRFPKPIEAMAVLEVYGSVSRFGFSFEKQGIHRDYFMSDCFND